MVQQHIIRYIFDVDGSIDSVSIDTYENNNVIHRENITITDLTGLYVGIKNFLEEIKRYKGKWMLKKKALDKLKKEKEKES